MFQSATDLPNNTELECDLCIVGGGVAGITIAREFAGSKLKVIVLESGGEGFDLPTQELYNGESSGTPAARRKNYLVGSRLRFLGGSSNHWAGYCRPLDPIDFIPREWLPGSGWPFRRTEIEPWFARAAAVLEIKPFKELSEPKTDTSIALIPAESEFDLRYFYFSPPTRFGFRYKDELASAENIQVLTMANVTGVQLTPNGSAVSQLSVATLSGRSHTVKAKRYVLALGGVENARLLLLSNGVQKNGVGNSHDLVGRYFMEHPQFPAGYLVVRDLVRSLQFLKRRPSPGLGHDVRAVLTVKPEVLEREKLNNVSIQVDKVERKPESLPTQVQAMEKMLRSLHREGGKEPRVDFAQLYVRMEQLPNRESRVVLDDSRDALGQSRSKLIWKLSEHEHRTGHRIMQLLAGELGSREAGRVISSEGDAPWLRLEVSSHHLGTTRMDPDSTRGVVDTNCTVHGVDNLHVAGSSVFPSGGFANPTFTIVALALRLSDRLKGLLK